MLPYIYSVFATEVASEAGATLQRALVMEFPDDLAVRQTADSFMFGSSFLVFPVLKYQEASHKCYHNTKNYRQIDDMQSSFARLFRLQ